MSKDICAFLYRNLAISKNLLLVQERTKLFVVVIFIFYICLNTSIRDNKVNANWVSQLYIKLFFIIFCQIASLFEWIYIWAYLCIPLSLKMHIVCTWLPHLHWWPWIFIQKSDLRNLSHLCNITLLIFLLPHKSHLYSNVQRLVGK